eukprot:scaffold382_cov154-Amphora_coffeaeformis.AAC.7
MMNNDDDGSTTQKKGWTAGKLVARAHAHVIYGSPTDEKFARHLSSDVHVLPLRSFREAFDGWSISGT